VLVLDRTLRALGKSPAMSARLGEVVVERSGRIPLRSLMRDASRSRGARPR
jgi:hypothetical protein